MSNKEPAVTHLSSVARTGDAETKNPSPVARGDGSWNSAKRNYAPGAHSFRGGATNRGGQGRNAATRSSRAAVSTNECGECKDGRNADPQCDGVRRHGRAAPGRGRARAATVASLRAGAGSRHRRRARHRRGSAVADAGAARHPHAPRPRGRARARSARIGAPRHDHGGGRQLQPGHGVRRAARERRRPGARLLRAGRERAEVGAVAGRRPDGLGHDRGYLAHLDSLAARPQYRAAAAALDAAHRGDGHDAPR